MSQTHTHAQTDMATLWLNQPCWADSVKTAPDGANRMTNKLTKGYGDSMTESAKWGQFSEEEEKIIMILKKQWTRNNLQLHLSYIHVVAVQPKMFCSKVKATTFFSFLWNITYCRCDMIGKNLLCWLKLFINIFYEIPKNCGKDLTGI